MKNLPDFQEIVPLLSKKKNSDIAMLSTSDIHLAHGTVPTEETIEILDAIIDDKILHALDLLVLAGDIMERLVDMNELEGRIYIDWVTRCLRKCKQHNVVLFVLLGTPSHDWNQPAWFKTQNENSQIGCELYYADTVSVVRVHSLELDILAVPDLPNPDLLWEDVTRVMVEAKLTMVDFAIMHGLFEFQIPVIGDAKAHNSRKFLDIVRYLIFIGHDHITKIFERITVNGSPNRLRHGEEGPKGFYIAVIERDTGDYRLHFVENKWAKRFVQIRLSEPDVESMISIIKDKIKDLPADSHVQIITKKEFFHQVNLGEWRKSYPLLNWTFNPEKIKKTTQEEINFAVNVKPLSITRESLLDQALDRLRQRNVSDEVYLACKRSLEEYIEHVNT